MAGVENALDATTIPHVLSPDQIHGLMGSGRSVDHGMTLLFDLRRFCRDAHTYLAELEGGKLFQSMVNQRRKV
jgi:hypothetical protein